MKLTSDQRKTVRRVLRRVADSIQSRRQPVISGPELKRRLDMATVTAMASQWKPFTTKS